MKVVILAIAWVICRLPAQSVDDGTGFGYPRDLFWGMLGYPSLAADADKDLQGQIDLAKKQEIEDCSAFAPLAEPPDYADLLRDLTWPYPLPNEYATPEPWLRLEDLGPVGPMTLPLRLWDALGAFPFRAVDYVEVPQTAAVYQIRPVGAEFEPPTIDFPGEQKAALPQKFSGSRDRCDTTTTFARHCSQRQRGCIGRVRARQGEWLHVESPQSLRLVAALGLIPEGVDVRPPPCFAHTPALAQVSALVWVRARDARPLRTLTNVPQATSRPRSLLRWLANKQYDISEAWSAPFWLEAFDYPPRRIHSNCNMGPIDQIAPRVDPKCRADYFHFSRTGAQTAWLPPGTVLEAPDGSRAGITIGYAHLGPQWSYSPRRACYELAASPPYEGPNNPYALLHAATQYRSRLSCTDNNLRINRCSPERVHDVLAGFKRRATLVVCVRPEQVVGTVETFATPEHKHYFAPTGVAPCNLWRVPAIPGALE